MINTIEDLERVLKLLRVEGVLSFKMSGTEIILGEKPEAQSAPKLESAENPEYPSQAELDRAVNMPVSGLDDPFLTYNERAQAHEDI